MSDDLPYVAAAYNVEVAARNGGLFEDPHLLLIGQSGVGKSSLARFLIDGESRGVAGPEAGTREPLVTTPVQRNGVTFHVHDTVGLGDPTVDTDALKDSIRRHVPIKKCLVLLCVRFDARLVDRTSQLVFDFCHSLSPDIWKKVIVAVTHSDILPPEIDCRDRREAIEEAKATWKRQIRLKLRLLGVHQEDIDRIPVCFTTHTLRTNQVDCTWIDTLNAELNRLALASGCNGGFQFLVSTALRYFYPQQESSPEQQPPRDTAIVPTKASERSTFQDILSSLMKLMRDGKGIAELIGKVIEAIQSYIESGKAIAKIVETLRENGDVHAIAVAAGVAVLREICVCVGLIVISLFSMRNN